MTRKSDERRDFIAMHLGRKILATDPGKLKFSEVKEWVEQAREWMAQEQLRDDVEAIIKQPNVAEKLKERLGS